MARKRGFLKAVSQINLDQDESLIGQLHGECEKDSVISVIEKIFVPQNLPTALFCYSDEVAIEVMSWIMKQGIEFQRIYLCFHLTVFRLRDA